MWCHYPRLRNKNDKVLLLRSGDGHRFWLKQSIYDNHIGVARFFIEEFSADWKTHVKYRP